MFHRFPMFFVVVMNLHIVYETEYPKNKTKMRQTNNNRKEEEEEEEEEEVYVCPKSKC